MSVRTQAEIAHDSAMLEALKDVSTGAWNQSRRFLDGIRQSGCTTPRQRWWLTTLVVRHRKQLKPQFHGTLLKAKTWLRENQQAGDTKPRQRKAIAHPDDRNEPRRNTDNDLFP